VISEGEPEGVKWRLGAGGLSIRNERDGQLTNGVISCGERGVET